MGRGGSASRAKPTRSSGRLAGTAPTPSEEESQEEVPQKRKRATEESSDSSDGDGQKKSNVTGAMASFSAHLTTRVGPPGPTAKQISASHNSPTSVRQKSSGPASKASITPSQNARQNATTAASTARAAKVLADAAAMLAEHEKQEGMVYFSR